MHVVLLTACLCVVPTGDAPADVGCGDGCDWLAAVRLQHRRHQRSSECEYGGKQKEGKGHVGRTTMRERENHVATINTNGAGEYLGKSWFLVIQSLSINTPLCVTSARW